MSEKYAMPQQTRIYQMTSGNYSTSSLYYKLRIMPNRKYGVYGSLQESYKLHISPQNYRQAA